MLLWLFYALRHLFIVGSRKWSGPSLLAFYFFNMHAAPAFKVNFYVLAWIASSLTISIAYILRERNFLRHPSLLLSVLIADVSVWQDQDAQFLAEIKKKKIICIRNSIPGFDSTRLGCAFEFSIVSLRKRWIIRASFLWPNLKKKSCVNCSRNFWQLLES